LLEIEIKNESELKQLDGFEIENGMMMTTNYHNRMITTRSFSYAKKVRTERCWEKNI